jgi:hypothetical protein
VVVRHLRSVDAQTAIASPGLGSDSKPMSFSSKQRPCDSVGVLRTNEDFAKLTHKFSDDRSRRWSLSKLWVGSQLLH